MSIKPRFFMLLAALMAVMVIAAPGRAVAEAAAPTDQCADKNEDKSYQSAFQAVAAQRIQIANQTLGLFHPIDVKNDYCWTGVQNLQILAGEISDPLNLFWMAYEKQVLNMINNITCQVGQAVTGAVNGVVAGGLSQLNRICLPLPTFSIGGLSGIGLGVTAPTCTGISPLSAVSGPAWTPPPTYVPSLMIPTGQ